MKRSTSRCLNLSVLISLPLFSAFMLVGCNNTSFKSGSKKEAGDAVPVHKSAAKNIKIPCENGTSKIKTTLSGSTKTSVIVDGEFCGIPANSVEGKLTAFFVLDFSGSMRINDPIISGSCGRLKAAEAIVAKLEDSIIDGVELSAGFLQFDSRALPAVKPVALDSFKSHLTEARFCGDSGGATNYEAALAATKDALKNVDGNKVVYFISDGMPTQAGTSPLSGLFGGGDAQSIYDAGQKAAESLRSEVSNLTLNAVYLGYVEGAQGNDVTVESPEAYLEKITGSKDNVKMATNADALASEIVKFETPNIAELDTNSVKGEVAASGFSSKSFTVSNLKKDDGRDGVWTFATDSIDLFATAGKAVENTIKISIKGSDGKVYEAVAQVTVDNQK